MKISNGFARWPAATAFALLVGLIVSGCGGVNESPPAMPASGSAADQATAESAGKELERVESAMPAPVADGAVTQEQGPLLDMTVADDLSGTVGGGGFGGRDIADEMPAAAGDKPFPTEAPGAFFGDDTPAARKALSKRTTRRKSGAISSELEPATEAIAGTPSLSVELQMPTQELTEQVVEEKFGLKPAAAGLSRTAQPMPEAEENSGVPRVVDGFNSPGGQQGLSRGSIQKFSVESALSALTSDRQKALQLDLQPGEELWIIAKAADQTQASTNPDTPRCGCLMATLPGETTQVPVPLKHTAVDGNIDGYIATVDVQQQFHNPYDSKIEAVYVFPLPESAAVNEFVMTVGDRKIRGIIREREKAEKIYAAARSQGHVASLMTQERANIFTQKVANIEPGKQIDINIRYFNTLQYDDGAYEFVFPMVVGPRFNPPAVGSDGVGAVPRKANGSSGQKTEVSYLSPTERSGHDISLSLKISAGVDIEAIRSVNHRVDVQDVCESQRKVTLANGDTIPNKDFVLRYTVAGDQIKTALMTHEDENGKYFTMMLYPPADLAQVNRSPMEMVFVLDCSGSMSGQPIAQAKAAIRHALQSLTSRDTFQIIRFSNNASQLGPDPVLATEENIKRGLKYLKSLNGSGGTHMLEGIKAALDFPHDEGRFRLVSFMTDGFIGNEQQILGTLYDKLGASRVFSFGVGSSPNRMLMNRMAILGRGAATYLSLNDDAISIMDRFNRRISHPAMTDLAIDWGDMNVTDVYPQRLPDLIVGRPVVITGRFEGEPSTVSVNGRVDMEPKSFTVALDDDGVQEQHAGIAAVWARLKIKDMMNVASHAPEAATEIQSAVTQTALAYNLMSSFTAFVAVDSMTKTEGDYGTTVAVPVPVPDGVKYQTTVGTQN